MKDKKTRVDLKDHKNESRVTLVLQGVSVAGTVIVTVYNLVKKVIKK